MHRLPLIASALLLAGSGAGSAAAQEAPRVVASIAPVWALVAGVTEGVTEPVLLMNPNISPHDYALRPSEGEALQDADVVFWVGPQIEQALPGALDSLAGEALVVRLSLLPGVTALPVREGGAYEPHVHAHHHGEDEDDHAEDDHDAHEHDEDVHEDDHDHDHDEDADHDHDGDHEHGDDDHHDGSVDMHMWLDPANAIVWTDAIAATLAEVDPAHAAAYRANADAQMADLDALSEEIDTLVAPVRDRPFLVFHDAYQYLEARFGLAGVGSITINPDLPLSPQRIYDVRARLVDTGAVCVFAEPQFDQHRVAVVTEGTETRIGVLDPLGGTVEGPRTYQGILLTLAHALVDCLGRE
ncbi:MAG: zinc ABC transporter substrate-binding protein [Rhodospirillaceae bacterium]|nr:zinc ABC transporter substrate-binding protein [Rhodospirillaceae bacterium]